jgi:hypothetical protein
MTPLEKQMINLVNLNYTEKECRVNLWIGNLIRYVSGQFAVTTT